MESGSSTCQKTRSKVIHSTTEEQIIPPAASEIQNQAAEQAKNTPTALPIHGQGAPDAGPSKVAASASSPPANGASESDTIAKKGKGKKGKEGDQQAKTTGRQRANGAKTKSQEPPPPSTTEVEDDFADLPDLADLIAQVKSQLEKEG